MDAMVLKGEGPPEGETVCAAMARYEADLHNAVREIHVDVSAFKLGVERRLDEALDVSGPLGRLVLQLQQENRQLRSQLEALTRQVEALSGTVCDRSALINPAGTLSTATQLPVSPSGASSPTGARFSSRATFSVSSKNNVSTTDMGGSMSVESLITGCQIATVICSQQTIWQLGIIEANCTGM